MKYTHDRLGDDTDHIERVRKTAMLMSKIDYPDYVLEDRILSTEGDHILTRVEDPDGNIYHVILISSFDGFHWFCWIIERQVFDIMETERPYE